MPTTITKFCEGGWRFLFYSVMFIYGFGVLFNKAQAEFTPPCPVLGLV